MSLLSAILIGAGLLGPGWLLGRALGTRGGWLDSFIGSAVVLTNLLLMLDGLNLGLTSMTVSSGLALICCVLVIIARQKAVHLAPAAATTDSPGPPRRISAWFWLPTAIGLIAIGTKTWLDPLSGYDTTFRWDFLAQQMFRHESLRFYPAVTPKDFELYGWCDGIAPLVSGIYFWCYLSLGQIRAGATAPAVILQAVLLFGAVHQLASRKIGATGGRIAMAVLATSSILLWAVAMGQETGLTALALVAMLLFLERSREIAGENWLIWAGLAAGLGALAREYGLLFVFLGIAALASRRLEFKRWLKFGLPAVLVSAPWYIRNWIRTDNPLWPHNVAHVFPVNIVHAEYMRVVSDFLGIGSSGMNSLLIGGTALALLAVPLLLALSEFARPTARIERIHVIAIVMIIGLWIWSVGQTSAGYVYSLRMLSPAIALCSVIAGRMLVRAAHSNKGWIFAVGLSLGAFDAAGRSFFLPMLPFNAWWRIPVSAWFQHRDASHLWNNNKTWSVVAATAASEKILVASPYAHAVLTRHGAHPVPLFSPVARFLCEEGLNFPEALSRLRGIHIRFVLLSASDDVVTIQLSKHTFFQQLRTCRSIKTPVGVLFDLQALQ